ncbi:uncharacterized protein LOC124953556 [Vespa velutina]|uniref:uncharacterized protein LOC124953556 n=1 Tax=Vespa velutina TaxID=202808 RepID=UPI001FB554E1|nr:uncharacterized protein LOC124953556 [Vespa velutina]
MENVSHEDPCRHNVKEYTENLNQEIPSDPSFLRTKLPHFERLCRMISKIDEHRFRQKLEYINLETLNKEEKVVAKEMIKNALELFHLPGDTTTGVTLQFSFMNRIKEGRLERKQEVETCQRILNEKTIKDSYPLSNITDILDQLGSAKYFTIFDLASGFHQIEMNKGDAQKTAFSTTYGHYEFTRMPFGLKNAPSTF